MSDRGADLEAEVRRLDPVSGDSIEDLFVLAEENLRQGKLRLVFFMEEAPIELKSIVDFLNRQTEKSEILIVEARQYAIGEQRLLSPRLFGYTEQARKVKQATTMSSGARRKWTEDEFFAEVTRQLNDAEVAAVRRLHETCKAIGCEFRWGTGAQTGSFSPSLPSVTQKSLLTVYTTGAINLNFGWLNTSPEVEAFRDHFAGLVTQHLGWKYDRATLDRFPGYKASEWVPRVDQLLVVLEELRNSARISG